MEINITQFVTNADPFEFSASEAERGPNAGRDTWNNAKVVGAKDLILTTPEQLDALRDYMRGFGAWKDDEIDGWSEAECNAMFIQEISARMREAGMDEVFLEDFDWVEYEERVMAGEISGPIYRGDDGQFYFNLAQSPG